MELSEHAAALIEHFEQQMKNVPAQERDAVLKRITSHISALNEDVEDLLTTLRGAKPAQGPEEHRLPDSDHASQYI